MAEFVFTSPGIKFRERDISFVTRNVGVTTLGVVGETLKGPAFEPIFLQDKNNFLTRLGGQSIEKFPNGKLRYHAPYVANAYLEESNQLWFTRVLGLSGYDAGKHWAITLSAGIDTTTIVEGATGSSTVAFTNNTYLGVTLNQVGDTGSTFTGYTKTGTDFDGIRHDFTVDNITNGDGDVTDITTALSGTSLAAYEDMVLAVIRPRGTVTDNDDAAPTTEFDADSLVVTSNGTNTGIGDVFGEFELTATKSGDGSTEVFTVSLDPNATSYLPSVLGSDPNDKNSKIWNEESFPDLMKKIDANGLGYGINTTISDGTIDTFTNYKDQYQTPETPWVVSELRGSSIDRLFKFVSISDGDAANKEIKISITDIDPVSREFNVIVRDFFDTDSDPIVLESFTRCSMRKGENNFIGRRIGTTDGNYPLLSEFIMLEIDDDAPEASFPAGFEGYQFIEYSATTVSTTVHPELMFKTSYATDEKASRVFLGISENAYDGTGLKGTGINQNYFNFKGYLHGDSDTGFIKTNGFHMDSGATGTGYTDGSISIGTFVTGAGKFQTSADVQDGDVYGDSDTRKFTLVPYGGFDGWNEHRQERSYGDLFRKGGVFDGVADGATPSNDFQAWETAIATFANPEEITINLFTTPGINWSDQLVLVDETIEMIEKDRADSLYIIDAPDIDVAVTVGERADIVVANDIVDLLSTTNIDSSYSTTYFPWIQIPDTQNNVNVFLPATGEVVRAMAFTDNVKFPWFSTAGMQRGVTGAKKSKYKLSEKSRDILYKGRINPLADFTDVGTTIFGQKTLQVKESALDRINVRRLLLQVKTLISNIAIRLLFEQNDQTTIDQFLSKVNPLLDSIRRERGLEAFEVKMDDSINSPESRDRNELFGEIKLKPIKAVEFIGITFTITPSGASFEDV